MTSLANVPNVPIDPMFELKDQDVILTSVGKNFFEQLISYFFANFSNEGLVAPTQTTDNITQIVANTNAQGEFTAGDGRIFYNSTTNTMQVTIDNGAGQPIIKTFTLT